jgi:triacylglycerol esterase/lipase EstA (alpha/beta hydrolase family)
MKTAVADVASPSWLPWVLAPALFVALLVLFVLGSYALALLLTRGAFGWPGLLNMGREAALMSFTQSILPLGWTSFGGRGAAAIAPGARPVVFVHGYSQNRSNFVWLARYLERRGGGPFFGFNYFSLGSIEASARSLAAYVEGVVRKTGAEQVDLVCHSLGGLVARTYVDLLDGHARVRRVVTLGTPHRGVRHAKLGFGRSAREMHPESGFIPRLEQACLPSTVDYHSIYSVHDNIVYPSHVSSLGARGNDVVVRGHGHFGILFSVEVAEHVFAVLAMEAGGGVPARGASQVATALGE